MYGGQCPALQIVYFPLFRSIVPTSSVTNISFGFLSARTLLTSSTASEGECPAIMFCLNNVVQVLINSAAGIPLSDTSPIQKTSVFVSVRNAS